MTSLCHNLPKSHAFRLVQPRHYPTGSAQQSDTASQSYLWRGRSVGAPIIPIEPDVAGNSPYRSCVHVRAEMAEGRGAELYTRLRRRTATDPSKFWAGFHDASTEPQNTAITQLGQSPLPANVSTWPAMAWYGVSALDAELSTKQPWRDLCRQSISSTFQTENYSNDPFQEPLRRRAGACVGGLYSTDILPFIMIVQFSYL